MTVGRHFNTILIKREATIVEKKKGLLMTKADPRI